MMDDIESVVVDENELLRRDLLARLTKAGLDYSSKLSEDGDQVYIIIHASEPRLMEAAEATMMEIKLKKQWQVPYAAFTIDRQDDFVWENRARGKFFSTRDRQTLIMSILDTGDFDSVNDMAHEYVHNKEWRDKYGRDMMYTCGLHMDGLQHKGAIEGFWALHGEFGPGVLSRRQQLLENWAYNPFKVQPLEMIFEYFNSKTALYFGFIGYYSMWLAFSAVIGVAVTIHTHLRGNDHRGNDVVIGYGFIMAFWGTLFLEGWKRYNAELAYRWSVINLHTEERERSVFRMNCTEKREGFYTESGAFIAYDDDIDPKASFCQLNGVDICGSLPLPYAPDTQAVDEKTRDAIDSIRPGTQAYMSSSTRSNRQCVNGGVAIFFAVAVLSILVSFLLLRNVFQRLIDAQNGPMLASVAQALCTVVLNMLYMEIAVCMVNYENYRTDMEWENAIVKKVFPFQFINSYFTLFYVAFMKGKFGTLMGSDDRCIDSLGNRDSNCMTELTCLLLSTLLTTQIAGAVAELAVPYLQYKFKIWMESENANGKELSNLTHEAKLQPTHPLDAFYDYNKMVLQFGFVSMFVAAFPLAPLCALINNVIEIRTDAMKRLLATQRPSPSMRAENIGEWLLVLEFMSYVAVATNIGVLCFTSPRFSEHMGLSNAQTVWAFIILEHSVILIKIMIAHTIDDMPEWVALRLARDEYMLQEREEIMARQRDEKRALLGLNIHL